jgi:hypothetical protein
MTISHKMTRLLRHRGTTDREFSRKTGDRRDNV